MIEFKNGLFGEVIAVFEMIVCCTCKIPFMVMKEHKSKLIKTGETFYCPNGHEQHFTATQCDKQKKELDKTKELLNRVYEIKDEILQENYQLKKQLSDTRKNTCPHCHKRFINLDRHILKQHENENR